MSTAIAIRPEITEAVAEVRFEAEFPLQLQIVTADGQSKVIPMGSGYAITIDEFTTEAEIHDLGPVLTRLANTFDRVWPF